MAALEAAGCERIYAEKRSGAETDRKTLMRSPQYRVEIRGIQSVLGSPASGPGGHLRIDCRDLAGHPPRSAPI